MVQCELCGKVTRTTQGLRGHKTFVHGFSANRSKTEDDHENNNTSDYIDKLNKLIGEVCSLTEMLNDLKWKIRALQNQLALTATSTDINNITTNIESLNKRVKKHDQWFNPKGIDELVLGLSGGPIASLDKRLDNIQRLITSGTKARSKF